MRRIGRNAPFLLSLAGLWVTCPPARSQTQPLVWLPANLPGGQTQFSATFDSANSFYFSPGVSTCSGQQINPTPVRITDPTNIVISPVDYYLSGPPSNCPVVQGNLSIAPIPANFTISAGTEVVQFVTPVTLQATVKATVSGQMYCDSGPCPVQNMGASIYAFGYYSDPAARGPVCGTGFSTSPNTAISASLSCTVNSATYSNLFFMGKALVYPFSMATDGVPRLCIQYAVTLSPGSDATQAMEFDVLIVYKLGAGTGTPAPTGDLQDSFTDDTPVPAFCSIPGSTRGPAPRATTETKVLTGIAGSTTPIQGTYTLKCVNPAGGACSLPYTITPDPGNQSWFSFVNPAVLAGTVTDAGVKILVNADASKLQPNTYTALYTINSTPPCTSCPKQVTIQFNVVGCSDTLNLTGPSSNDQPIFSDDATQLLATVNYVVILEDHATLRLEVQQPDGTVVQASESYLINKVTGLQGGQRITVSFNPPRPPDVGGTLNLVGTLRDDNGNLIKASDPVPYKLLVKTGNIADWDLSFNGTKVTAVSTANFLADLLDVTYTLYHQQAALYVDRADLKADGSVLRQAPGVRMLKLTRGTATSLSGQSVFGQVLVSNDAAAEQFTLRMVTADGQVVQSTPYKVAVKRVHVDSVTVFAYTGQQGGTPLGAAKHGDNPVYLPLGNQIGLVVNCSYGTGGDTGHVHAYVDFESAGGRPVAAEVSSEIENGSGAGTYNFNVNPPQSLPAGMATMTVRCWMELDSDRDVFIDSLRLSQVVTQAQIKANGGKIPVSTGVTFDQIILGGVLPVQASGAPGDITTTSGKGTGGSSLKNDPAMRAATTIGGPLAFIPIGYVWQFDPPVPANGSFSASMTFNYATAELPDDPNFSEKAMQVISYNPTSNVYTTYPTTVDTVAQTATATVDRLDSFWTLGTLGPFTQATLNSALPLGSGAASGGAVVINTGTNPVNLGAAVYTPPADPTQPAWAPQTATTSTAPGAQVNTATSADLSPLITPSGGWLQLHADSSSAVGASILAIGSGLDALPLSAATDSPAFTAVESDGTNTTWLYLTNATPFAATAELDLYDPTGTQVDTAYVEIAAKQQYSDSIDALFQQMQVPFHGYVLVSASQPLVAAQAWMNQDVIITALAGQRPAPATRLYAPVAVAGNGQTLRLSVINTSSQITTLTLRGFADNGTPLGSPVTAPLGPGAQLWADASAFPIPAGTAFSGWIQVDSTVAGIMGDVSFGNAQGRADLPLTPLLATSGILPLVANDGVNLSTAITFANPSGSAAKVQATVLDPSGNKTGSGTVPLAANARAVMALGALVPAAAGQTGGYVTFTSDQGVIGYETVGQPGGDFAAIPILPAPGTAATAAPAIAVQASLAFGSVTVGQTKTLQLAIGNTGNAALSVTGFTGLIAPFALNAALPISVAPGTQQSISIVFSPTAAAASTVTLTISSNDPAHPSLMVSITGMGQAAAAPTVTVAPATLAFGSVNVGGTSNMQVAVANSGTTAVTVSLATAAPFSVSPASLTISANGNASATVSFAPASATPATQTGQLHVTLGGQDVTGSPVSLGGTAVAPTAQLSVSPTSIANLTSPGVNQAGPPQPVTITNSGTGAGAASLITAAPFFLSTSMTGTFTATADVNVSSQSSITVYVRFLPSSATPATQTGTLAITSVGQPITGSPVSLSGSISGSGPGTASFTGTWNTDRGGTMVLVQTGANVNGTYANNGKISGTLSGNTLSGTWSDNTGLGTFSFTLSADGNSFTGNWLQILVPGGGTWNGTRVSSH